MSSGQTIVIGVAGGIAAYKAVEIVSRLKKAGHTVYVIMTKAATEFVTPLTFREISGNPVVADMWEEPKTWNVQHIALASRANLFLIAPATANIIGKIANGIADDMLTTTVMATKAPIILAPAMNTNMYLNPITQQNLNKLAGLGYHIVEPASGMLACGVDGPGRLPEPADIVKKVKSLLQGNRDLAGKRVLVTAAGTREPIDPVRYIGNHSSGKMGYALAEAAAARGAEVILVSGPSSLACPAGITVKKVETAAQMREAVLAEFDTVDVVIKAAAVADYRPETAADQKIKKPAIP
jgi:phosphopantothenoylcysteine decarboxylase/phosphopantothenate--cysteine ligase